MVTRERLQKFIGRRCREIRRQVSYFCTTRDGEALHILRVEIKRLRAALVLLRSCTTGHHLSDKGLKELYKAAGVIRTAQINLNILQELDLESQAFAEGQKQFIEDSTLAFCLAAPRYRHAVLEVQASLQAGAVDIKPQSVRALFRERMDKLSLFFSAPALDTVALHDTRKETKELLYMYTLLPPALAASLPLNKDYLDRLQRSLGTWHDNTVALSLLQGFEGTKLATLEKLQSADALLLQEVKDLAADFDQKINAVPEGGQDERQSGSAPHPAASSSSADP